MNDLDYQKKNLEVIFRDASLAPVFKQNAKYYIGELSNLTPYISYDDVMRNKFIIRGRPVSESGAYYNEKKVIIAEYDSIVDLVSDGWRLD